MNGWLEGTSLVSLLCFLHAAPFGGGGVGDVTWSRRGGGEVDDPPPTQAPCGKVVSRWPYCSSFTSEDKHSLTETCRRKWKVGLLCRAAATSRFSPNIQGFLRILNRRQDKERSFRGRIQSNEMRNMILTALLLVHLPTGEALKAL